MRFGGHQTFALRDGWLYKGLRMLCEDPAVLASDQAPDLLGVGSNMAKSIRYWLLATELATREHGAARNPKMTVSDLGSLVFERDRYFLQSGTWWALHINLVNSLEHAAVWPWFFNRFSRPRFERATCVENLIRHVQLHEKRRISPNTLRRDVACLLQSYSRVLPPIQADPEELRECPLVELGLLQHFRETGSYQLEVGPKPVPAEILGYAVARPSRDRATVRAHKLQELMQLSGGPARTLVMTGEALVEVLQDIASHDERFEMVGLGGQKVLRIPGLTPIEWLTALYDRVAEASNAA